MLLAIVEKLYNKKGIFKNTSINTLENMNRTVFPEWQRAGLLKGELILLLDENDQTDLCGYHLTYTREKGLIVTK